MSFHMKPKRSCPGVPNRYSLRLASIVMQPKSMATVVVVLPGRPSRLSMPAATEVISASVVRGLISEMLATVVVLPTPNPPAITILTGSGGRRVGRCSSWCSGDGAEPMDDPQNRVDVLCGVGVRQVGVQVPLG